MPRLFLAEIHRRVVIEAGPLDGATEVTLRADPRPGAKAILHFRIGEDDPCALLFHQPAGAGDVLGQQVADRQQRSRSIQ